MRKSRSLMAACAIALALIAAAVTIVLVRQAGATGGKPVNDSSIFGVEPADLTRVPPFERTMIAAQVATRAVLLQTPTRRPTAWS